MKEKIRELLIIGPLPQKHGIGGVTIHVQRLLDYMDINNIPYSFVDYKEKSIRDVLAFIRKATIVHLHISNPKYQFMLALLCCFLRKKSIITVHGNYGRFRTIDNFWVRMSIRFATIPVLINQGSYEKCKKFNKRAQMVPAFIPPQKQEVLEPEIIRIINRIHGEGKKIVSTNAYNVTYDKKGNEIYGIDFLVDFFRDNKNYELVVSDPSGNYKKKYPNTIESVEFINYPHPYFELLKYVDYFVRNTSTDGDALSVKEALYLKKPVICTDVVDRPDGVYTFKYSEKKSFMHCMCKASSPNTQIENGAVRIVKLYKELGIK